MNPQKPHIQIDFVSDVACPWCAIGLASLEQALAQVGDGITYSLRFQPFQLNPNMPPEGQDIGEHLSQKYGSTAAQQAQNYEAIRQRGAALGFEFNVQGRGRTWNTFDCHRLLEWVADTAPHLQLGLKRALLKAYFTQAQNPADRTVLLTACEDLGLDRDATLAVLNSDAYALAVSQRQRFYAANEIHSVPAIIFNEQHLVSGGQPPQVFESALRQIAQLAPSA